MIIRRQPKGDFLFRKIIPTPSNNKIDEVAKLAPPLKEFPKIIGVQTTMFFSKLNIPQNINNAPRIIGENL